MSQIYDLTDNQTTFTDVSSDYSFSSTETGSGASSGNSVKSVFELEYIPTSKAAKYDVMRSGYFVIGESSATTKTSNDASSTSLIQKAKSAVLSSADVANYIAGSFWQMVIYSIAEIHEEKYSLHNTISDSVSLFSTGAKPIMISISGYLLLSGSEDYHYTFMQKYVDEFRARHLSANNKHLLFVSQDTEFNLIIHSIAIGHTIDFETYVPLTISGLAYNYKMRYSNEPFSLGYYGTNVSTDNVATELEDKEEEQTEEAPLVNDLTDKPVEQTLTDANGLTTETDQQVKMEDTTVKTPATPPATQEQQKTEQPAPQETAPTEPQPKNDNPSIFDDPIANLHRNAETSDDEDDVELLDIRD